MKVDPEVGEAVKATGKALAAMGHTVEPAEADIGGVDALTRGAMTCSSSPSTRASTATPSARAPSSARIRWSP